MTDGIAALPFVDDIKKLIGDKWINSLGGKLPTITKQWKIKQVGTGTNIYDEIIISIDSENPQIFSLMKGDATSNTTFEYDWLHDISITLDVRTAESEIRVLQLVNMVMKIIKTNVVPVINDRQYIQILPEGLTSMNEEYRNIFRYLISVSALRFNP